MAKTADLTFYKGLDGWVKIGEIQMEEDGSLTGQISKDSILGFPQILTQVWQQVAFAVILIPSEPPSSKHSTS